MSRPGSGFGSRLGKALGLTVLTVLVALIYVLLVYPIVGVADAIDGHWSLRLTLVRYGRTVAAFVGNCGHDVAGYWGRV